MPKPIERSSGNAWIIATLAILSLAGTPLCQSLCAKEVKELTYLHEGEPDAAALLPPPPLRDSPEQAADMAEVQAACHAASSNDVAAAFSEKKFSVFNLAPAVGPFFQSNNLPVTTAFFARVQTDAAAITDGAKDHFQRPRPYVVDPSLASGKLEKSFSYPSGHATESMVLALVLSELYPEKRDAILAGARSIGWHRVEIARHYPTDIYVGQTLAQAIVRSLKSNSRFQHDFGEARKELSSAGGESRSASAAPAAHGAGVP